MPQLTFARQPSFEKYAKKSRRAEFLGVMEKVVPWRELESLLAPYYPRAGGPGDHAAGLLSAAVVFALRSER